MDRSIRILEIGGYSFAKTAYPEQTMLLWTGRRPSANAGGDGYADCTPIRFREEIAAANAGKYHVVLAHMSTMSPWHPRHWLRSLGAEPMRPLQATSRVFGTSWLRHVSLRTPLVAIDFNDTFLLERHNRALVDKADLVFKRELPADRWLMLCGIAHTGLPSRRFRRSERWQRRLQKFEPLTLPTHVVDVAPLWEGDFPEKTADVFFAGNVTENSWVRRSGVEELRALARRGIRVDFPDQPVPPDEFLRRLSRAWIAWSPPGFGWECNRTAEAAQCLTVPVLADPTIERHRPLQDGEHAFFYPIEPGGLTRAIEQALGDKERLRRMANAARAHVLAHHSWPALVDYVIDRALALPFAPATDAEASAR